MSGNSDAPVAVTVSAYTQDPPGSDNDYSPHVYATAVDLSNYTPAVVAAPAQDHMVTYARPMTQQPVVIGVQNPYAGSLMALSENIVRAVSLSRSLKCLAAVDAVILLLFSIFWPVVLILLVGPLCGYMGASRYKIQFIYAYGIYWGFRLVIDLMLISQGMFWFLISLFVDVYIIRYLYIFATILKNLTPQDLDILSTATQSNSDASHEGRYGPQQQPL